MPEAGRKCVAAGPGRTLLRAAGTGLGLTLVLAAVSERASAEMMFVNQSELVMNQQSNVFSFSAPGPGMLSIELSDVVWPAPLTSLSFSLNTAHSVLAWIPSAAGLTLNMKIANGGTYYADVIGQAGGALGMGLYSLQVGFQPQGVVPLPPSIILLLSGLAALGGFQFFRLHKSDQVVAARGDSSALRAA